MKNPTVHRPICGTENGYRNHTKRTEEACQPCREAWTDRCRKYNRPAKGAPKIAEIIDEIEHLTSLNQGSHYILKAIDYIGRERQLRDRLNKHGRLDLFNRVITAEYQAAA